MDDICCCWHAAKHELKWLEYHQWQKNFTACCCFFNVFACIAFWVSDATIPTFREKSKRLLCLLLTLFNENNVDPAIVECVVTVAKNYGIGMENEIVAYLKGAHGLFGAGKIKTDVFSTTVPFSPAEIYGNWYKAAHCDGSKLSRMRAIKA